MFRETWNDWWCQAMSRLQTAGAVAVLVLAAIAGGGVALAVCDNMGASGSVGACYQPDPNQYTCEGMTTQTNCTSSAFLKIHVEEDFPNSCTAQDGVNCNTPLENCWQPIKCLWTDGTCVEDPDSGGPWQQVSKRTTVTCTD